MAFLCFMHPNYADETKRRNAINDVITHELGYHPLYEVKESIFRDTVILKANDSTIIAKSLSAFNSLNTDFVDNCAEFVALFPEGTKTYNPELLNDNSLTEYKILAKQMRKGLDGYRDLIDCIDKYQPYYQRRLYEQYEVKNGRGQILEYYGIYFFDSEDSIERYFWFDSTQKKTVNGLINLAKMHNFEFIETILDRVGIEFGKELITYLISDEDTRLPSEEVLRLRSERKTQIKRQQTRQSQNRNASSSQTSQTQHDAQTNVNVIQRENVGSHYVYNNHDIYVVKKDICGATFTKETMKQFTDYSIKDNTTGINFMLATGELVVLRKGQKVIMVDPGIILSRVMLENGKTVYTDTENITKLEP